MTVIEIKEIEKVKLRNPIIIEGFPGMGMVGTIGASYMTEKLGMKLIGYIASSHFPPIAAIHNYKPVSPARIYASEKHNIIALFSEFVIPAEVVYPLSNAIIDYAKSKKASAIYSLAGIAVPEPANKIYGIASTDKIAALLKKNNVELIKEGATQGVSGILIAACAAEKIPAANILVQTNKPMDPKAAAKLLDTLSKLIDVPIETKPLIAEGDKVEENMRQAVEKMSELKKQYDRHEENPMYQ